MSKIQDKNYIVIQGWMLNELKLKGNELLVYSIIYGFSQDNESFFTGSRQYLADWCNTSLPTIDVALKKLLEKGLIEKEVQTINGVNFNRYKKTLYPLKKLYTPPKETLYNNIDNNIDNNNTTTNKAEKNDFKEVIDFYNNNIGLLTPYGLEVLESYLEDFDVEVIIYAMQKSVEANKRNIQYIKAILNNWSKQGIRTLIGAKEESNNFNKKETKNDIEEEKRRKREEWENSD